MEKLKEALIIVGASAVGIAALILWILSLIKKKATERQLKDLQAKVEAERKAKAALQKENIEAKTSEQIMASLPEKEKQAITSVVDDNTKATTQAIMSELKKRAIR